MLRHVLRAAFVLTLLSACERKELRGQWTPSEDGKTYLMIVESPGCTSFVVNGKPWPHPLRARGAVSPGVRRIACVDGSNEVQFEVKAGTTFRFDYWGP
jgi:hypothetical protein